MPNGNSLQGRTILIVQWTGLIASTIADAFEAGRSSRNGQEA